MGLEGRALQGGGAAQALGPLRESLRENPLPHLLTPFTRCHPLPLQKPSIPGAPLGHRHGNGTTREAGRAGLFLWWFCGDLMVGRAAVQASAICSALGLQAPPFPPCWAPPQPRPGTLAPWQRGTEARPAEKGSSPLAGKSRKHKSILALKPGAGWPHLYCVGKSALVPQSHLLGGRCLPGGGGWSEARADLALSPQEGRPLLKLGC